jgi:hypothetical protein
MLATVSVDVAGARNNQPLIAQNVCFESEADIPASLSDVRFTPKADIDKRDLHVR